jgi:hypothetical protein
MIVATQALCDILDTLAVTQMLFDKLALHLTQMLERAAFCGIMFLAHDGTSL